MCVCGSVCSWHPLTTVLPLLIPIPSDIHLACTVFFFLSAIKYSQERPLITEDPPRMCCLIQACNPKNVRRGDMDVFGKSFLVSGRTKS